MSTNTATESPEIKNSWNKFADTARKAGFRDGAADGREKVFQKSFDEGYQEGFKIGYALGQYKGLLQANALPSNDVLEHTRRGVCQMCKNGIVTEDSIEELIQKQLQVSNDLLRNLDTKYSPLVTVKLKNEL
ncbi:hypothetical protein FQR65_LT00796 [Abscondita terminalis]|nr:hypothetical protein FQR65_LT00796 [Abscondita terminalis]